MTVQQSRCLTLRMSGFFGGLPLESVQRLPEDAFFRLFSFIRIPWSLVFKLPLESSGSSGKLKVNPSVGWGDSLGVDSGRGGRQGDGGSSFTGSTANLLALHVDEAKLKLLRFATAMDSLEVDFVASIPSPGHPSGVNNKFGRFPSVGPG